MHIPDDMEAVCILDVEPVAKPRMTRRDKWAKRPCVMRYWDYCDDLRLAIEDIDAELYKEGHLAIIFILPMPSSWSAKKRAKMKDQPHTKRPDLDNLVKAYKDAVFKEDSIVHTYDFMSKIWGETGRIIILKEKP